MASDAIGLNDHEGGFVRSFVLRQRQERFTTFLKSPKRRREILDRLNRGRDIDLRFARVLSGSESFAGPAAELLRSRGANTTAYIIAYPTSLDGREMPLNEALRVIQEDDFGAIVSCIPGRLALYKAESPGGWYLLMREDRRPTRDSLARGRTCNDSME